MTINDAADEISTRLTRIFLRDAHGTAASGEYPRLQHDPHLRDDLLFFFEYFHGDIGRGVGASHQTGWTGPTAKSATARGGAQP